MLPPHDPMQIQPIVIGTAGHIDHGKSTLVRTLTGIDPDRLKEEQERGMTIDLGFAPLRLPDGRWVGIVDVPGHERFVRNMVAGATGIDLVLLVVAADDGVMPQTREHLQIMELLGIARGIVVLSKIDAVEPELVDLAEEDVHAALRGTFLDDAPVCRLSCRTGEGLEAFRERLFRLAVETTPRSAGGLFRMPIQRVFSKRGLGTVVTGIPVSGEARLGDVLEILPGPMRGKVRGLNAYLQSVERIRAGHSSAINFADVDLHSVQRGYVVATPGYFAPQRMVAARLTALGSLGRPVTDRMAVRLHSGTADPSGELVLLDRDEILPGQSGLVQLRLQDPIVCAPGDRFVLRLASPVETLGGGTILEESRHRLKRLKGFVLAGLERAERSLASPQALLESALLQRGSMLVPTEELAQVIKRPREELHELLGALVREGRAQNPRAERWIHADALESALAVLRRALDEWFAAHAHRGVAEVLELRTRSGLEPMLLDVLLESEAERGALELLPGGRVRPCGRSAELSSEQAELQGRVEERVQTAAHQPPTSQELVQALEARPEDVRAALESLCDAGRLVHVGDGLHLARAHYDAAREAIVENCRAHGHLEIPALRDRLATTRKFLIPLLEHFDAQGLTIRQASNRILRRR
jgi:selenocysteine-specific elongation factor